MLLLGGTLSTKTDAGERVDLVDLTFSFDNLNNVIITVHHRDPVDKTVRTLMGHIEMPPSDGRELVTYLSTLSPYKD